MVKKELLRFAIAGTVGFVVDAGVLYLVKDSLGYYLGRALSFFLAVFCTWLLNRQFTFHEKASGVSPVLEFIRYFWLMLGGGAINYLTYAALIHWFSYMQKYPVWAVAAGSVASMTINFLSLKYVLYSKQKKHI